MKMDDDIWNALAIATQRSVEDLKEESNRLHDKRVKAMQSKNQRYERALHRVTVAQSAVITSREAKGWKVHSSIWQNRASGNVAIPMQKNQVWDGARSRLGVKLAVIYPDGSATETFEKRVSIKGAF